VQLSILSRLPVKKRKDFFSYFSNQEELLKFYDKQKTTFYRKEKAKDIEYFRYFVLAIKKFEQDSPKIKTLTNYLKKIDPNYEDFLAKYQITIPKSAQRPRRINKKTTPKTQKNKTNQNTLSQEKKASTSKKIQETQHSSIKSSTTKLTTSSQQQKKQLINTLDIDKEIELMFAILKNPHKKPDGTSWYSV